MGLAAVGVLCFLQSYGVLSHSQGSWTFYLLSNPWRWRFRGCVALDLCFNPTARAITGGWGGWYSLQPHGVLGRPQESCAFSFAQIPRRGTFYVRVAFGFCFNPTVRAIPWGWGVWSSLHPHRVLGRPQWSCEFFTLLHPQGGRDSRLITLFNQSNNLQ